MTMSTEVFSVKEREPIPEPLMRMANRYPALRGIPEVWKKIASLVKAGEIDKAEAFAQSELERVPRWRIRNVIAIKHRLLRRQYLAFQRDLENQVKGALETLSARVGQMLINAAGSDGKIPPAKMNGILDRLKTYNTEAWTAVRVLISGGVRTAVKFGIDVTMGSAQAGLDVAAKAKESDVREAAKIAIVLKGTTVYQTIFDRVKKRRLEQGLFKNRKRGVVQVGQSLSRTIWDLRDGNLQRLRRTITTGIVNGRAATAVASDIKSMVVGGGTQSALPVGAGVYKSAFKNALRVTRSETNNAYVEAELEYANHKGYKKQWHVSSELACEICQGYDGEIFDPEDVPFPVHPNDSCYMSTVLPDIG